MSNFDQAKYIQKFQKENYDRITFDVPKGQKKEIIKHYKKNGYGGMAEYLRELIRKDMNSQSEESININVGQNSGIVMNKGNIKIEQK